MKTLLYTLLSVILLRACHVAGPENISLADYARGNEPASAALSSQEFRYYNKLVSRFFDSLLLSKGFNGSILVAKEGQVVYEAYQGLADLRKDDSLNENSALHIASVSKTFTALAVLQQVQLGRLQLSDSLQRFFPQFPYQGVTVKMLLNHHSGLPNYGYFLSDKKLWHPDSNVTNADVLRTLIEHHPAPVYRPGTRFNYCNTNFVLLAMILEQVSGLPYDQYLRQHFFDPLQMSHTYVYSPSDSLRAIPSFTARGGFWANDQFDLTYGDKNIYSTPRDLLKWDQAVHSGMIVNKALLDSAFTPYNLRSRNDHNYGLGWRLLMLPDDRKVVYHTGRWHGFNAYFARLPEEKVTIIVLGNRYNSRIYKTKHLYDRFGAYSHESDDEDEVNGG